MGWDDSTNSGHSPCVALVVSFPKGTVGAIIMFVEQLTLVTYEDECQDTILSVSACSISNCIFAAGRKLHSQRLHQVLQSESQRQTYPPTIRRTSHVTSVTRSSGAAFLQRPMLRYRGCYVQAPRVSALLVCRTVTHYPPRVPVPLGTLPGTLLGIKLL